MHQVMSSLLLYREGLKKKYANPLFDVPYPTLNLGSIHGGDNPNRICGHCELQFDVRLMPGMKPGERTERNNPAGRTGTPEEIQNLAAFLMSDGCKWISGETIALDGGQALGMGGNFYELRAWGDADKQLRERHSAEDFETQTWDKIGPKEDDNA